MTYRNEILNMAFERYGTQPESLFSKYPNFAVLRHPNKKWYGVIMDLPGEKVGRPGEQTVDVLNVKCDPVLSGSIRLHPGIYPGYHMNKEYWISVLLNGIVSMEEIGILLDISYDLVGVKKTHRRKQPE